MIETEHERKVREYWASAYDTIIKNQDGNKSWLANKFIDIFSGIGSTFSGITQNPSLLESSSGLEDICKSKAGQIQSINDCIDRLNEGKASH
jgi:hypothetical protein